MKTFGSLRKTTVYGVLFLFGIIGIPKAIADPTASGSHDGVTLTLMFHSGPNQLVPSHNTPGRKLQFTGFDFTVHSSANRLADPQHAGGTLTVDASNTSYAAEAGAPQYVVTDLGTLGGIFSAGYAINNSGQVTGESDTSGNSNTHAFLYSGGSMTDLGTLGGTFCAGYAINNSGQVTGYSDTSGDSATHAFLYSGGSMTDLGTLGGTFGAGYAINNSGQVTGQSNSSGNSAYHAFLYSGGSMTDLGTLGGTNSAGTGINDSGQVTGQSDSSGNSAYHAFLYSGGSMTDLGTLGGTNSAGTGINDSGQVAGYSDTSGNSAYHALLYSGGSMTDLGTLGGTNSAGYAINNSGQVMGYSDTSGNSAYHAFLYSGGSMTDLDNSVPVSAGVTSLYVNTINDRGQIAAFDYDDSNGEYRALLLTPRNMGTQFSGGLGDVSGGAANSGAYGVSNGGAVITGRATNANSGALTAFNWTLLGEMTDLNHNGNSVQSEGLAVSADGGTSVGYGDNGGLYGAFRYHAGVYQDLGFLPGHSSSLAQAVSADGSVVVGWSGVSGNSSSERSFVWTSATGMQPLSASLTTRAAATGVSGDGDVVVGYDTPPAAGAARAYRFRRSVGDASYQSLGALPGDIYSEAHGVSADGNVVVGRSGNGGVYQAFLWKDGTMTGLGDFTGGSFASFAHATSSDGAIVVGFGTDASEQRAFVWDAKHGLLVLQSVLSSEYGVDFAGWLLTDARGIAPDGSEIVGAAIDPLGNSQAFAAQINSRTYRFMSGETYAGFHTSHLGGLGTAVDLLGGAAGGAATTFRTVTVDTHTNNAVTPSASDIAIVTGTTTDTYSIQLNYDPATANNLFGSDQSLVLGWLGNSGWVNALDGNTGGAPMFVGGPYDGNATLGHCGVDTTNHVVWAVVNHGGQFMVINHVAPHTTFTQWRQANFTPEELNDPTISGENADPNRNGLSNLLEYAFNLDPHSPSTNAGSQPYAFRDPNDPNYFSLVYTKFLGADDLTYNVEESTTLFFWTAASPTNVVLADNGVTQIIRAKVPINGATKLFLRLNVSQIAP